jgi:predicted  nucleic acid-binding Zn-ribbon protein
VSYQFPLSQQTKAMEQLQELDLKIDQLNRTKNGLPLTLKELNSTLNKVRMASEAKQNVLNEMDKTQRQARAALDLGRDRLTRSNGRLEGIKNSQEFQAVSKEIEQLKKMNASLEEQLKKGDQEAEVVKKELEELTATLEKNKVEYEKQSALLSAEGGKLDAEIQALTGQREQYTSQVEKRILSLYDRVRVARNGLGIVPADGGRCKGCNMVVAPQLYNEICRGTALHTCPSCHRILFVPVQTG